MMNISCNARSGISEQSDLFAAVTGTVVDSYRL
jgi:hypothetical protein